MEATVPINFSAFTRGISSIGSAISSALNSFSIFRQCFRRAQNVPTTLSNTQQNSNKNFSDISQSATHIKKETKKELASDQNKNVQKSPPIATVDMGRSLTVTGQESLKTTGISDCTAIVILSNKENGGYKNRTLMHLTGSYLGCHLNGSKGEAIFILKKLNELLSQSGGKVIIVGGSNSSSDYGLWATITQKNDSDGSTSILELTKHKNVETIVAGAGGITVYADGHFDLEPGRGVLTPEESQKVMSENPLAQHEKT